MIPKDAEIIRLVPQNVNRRIVEQQEHRRHRRDHENGYETNESDGQVDASRNHRDEISSVVKETTSSRKARYMIDQADEGYVAAICSEERLYFGNETAGFPGEYDEFKIANAYGTPPGGGGGFSVYISHLHS